MTFVDDSLAGAAPVRGGKAGAKGAKPADLAAQKDAFNRAFSEAGKKQQPQISIREKAGAEMQDAQAAQSRIRIENADITAGADAKATGLPSGQAGLDEASLLETLQARQEAAAELDAARSAKEPSSSSETSKTRRDLKQAQMEAAQARIDARLGQSAAGEGSDAAAAEDAKATQNAMARKLADLFRERQAELASKAQPGAQASGNDDSSGAQPQQATGSDVNQLLAMLGAAQSAQAATELPGDGVDLGEFQALAERAGKPKSSTSEGLNATKAGAAHADGDAAETGGTPSAEKQETDKLFRFARADGKGQDVSIAINKGGDTATVDTGAAQSGKADTVTVVEARRYLGIAPNSNAQAVTSAIAGSSEWAQSLQSLANDASLQQQATGKVVNTLKIKMTPIDLGTVTATLRLKGDELNVDLRVETRDAYRQLSDDQNAIVKALRAQGFAVDQVNVTFSAPDSNNGNNAQQQQQPQPGGQFGREASAGGGAPQGRGERNGGDNQGDRWTANETTGDISSSDAGGAGDVYM